MSVFIREIIRKKPRFSDKTRSGGSIDSLARHVARELKKKKSCKIADGKLVRAWPYLKSERQYQISEIKSFARKNGWTADLVDAGITATFTRR